MNKLDKPISIAKDFARSTGGRVPEEGPNSGQEFRDNILVPALKKFAGEIVVDLDGTDGYGSSFLEEAFGGLVRLGFNAKELQDRFIFISNDDPTYEEEIRQYINEAAINNS